MFNVLCVHIKYGNGLSLSLSLSLSLVLCDFASKFLSLCLALFFISIFSSIHPISLFIFPLSYKFNLVLYICLSVFTSVHWCLRQPFPLFSPSPVTSFLHENKQFCFYDVAR